MRTCELDGVFISSQATVCFQTPTLAIFHFDAQLHNRCHACVD
jgi:hypothetical protein